jgi:curved DNA-binding protein
MAIEYKDYYETLGISRDAGDEDVRRAFRKLARLYHPDKAGNDRRAEDRFKEINEAYEVLSDPVRRQRYDEFDSAWQSNPSADEAWKEFARADGSFGSQSGASRSEHFTFTGSGFSEFFDQLFAERPEERKSRPQPDIRTRKEVEEQTDGRGDDLESDIWVTLEDVARGTIRPITMRRMVRCPTCYGMGQYNAHPCGRCEGKGSFLQSDTFKVKVPKGIQPGAALRIAGRGEQGVKGSSAGDLYLIVRYSSHPDFRFEKGHLIYTLEVAPWEAVLGTSVSVPTVDGSATIRIPAGTRNGHKLRVKGRGLPSADGYPSDLLVEVKVQVPATPATNERRLWEELSRESQFNPRDN